LVLLAIAGFYEQEKGTRRLLRTSRNIKRETGKTGGREKRVRLSTRSTDILENVNLDIIQKFIYLRKRCIIEQ